MLQIKTIRNRLDNAEAFDKEVNAALAEGWTLTKREVLMPKAQGERIQTHIMLYAELEREIITETEQCCENCVHYTTPIGKEPCISCSEDGDKWEPAR